MDVQTIFKRYELKYLLTKEQKDRLLEKASGKSDSGSAW